MLQLPKFQLGAIYFTPGTIEMRDAGTLRPYSLLKRHLSGDWGDMCDEDKLANEEALNHGGRIFSAYTLPSGDKVWVITEGVDEDGNRCATTLLRPDEY